MALLNKPKIRLLGPAMVLAATMTACTNTNPSIRSLNLTTHQIDFVQAQNSISEIVGDENGIFDFEMKCAQSMTILEYASNPNGPWNTLAPIQCDSNHAHVHFSVPDEINDSIYLRTRGSWGKSEPKNLALNYKLKIDISGTPEGRSNVSNFSVSVSGASLTSYRYGFGPAASTDCSQKQIYGEERKIDSPITSPELLYTGVADDDYRLCVVAKSKKGVWNRGEFAHARTWSKDTVVNAPILKIVNQKVILPATTDVLDNKEKAELNLEVSNDPGIKVSLYSDSMCSTMITSQTIEKATGKIVVSKDSLQQGANDFYLQSVDAAGNSTGCSKLITYFLDSINPEISSISGLVAQTYGVGQKISFDLNISEPVSWNKLAGVPVLQFKIEDKIKEAIYVDSQSTNNKLHFEYNVISGDNDGDGISIESPLKLTNDIQLYDSAMNPLKVTFNPPSTSDIKVDTAVPYVTSVTTTTTGPWLRTGNTIAFSINFSEIVKFSNSSNIGFSFYIGNDLVNANCPTPSVDANTIQCFYTILKDQIDTDGISIPNLNLVYSGQIYDLSYNSLTNKISATDFSNLKVDASSPTTAGVNLTDGVNSTSLIQSLPISWNASTDIGSGINTYTLQIFDNASNLVYSQAYGSPQSNLVVTGLSLTDLTNASDQYRKYTTKIIISDVAGNQSVVSGDGWNVIQWTQSTPIIYPNNSNGFASKLQISPDGQRLLVTVKNLRKVQVYSFNTSTSGWIFQEDLNDPQSSGDTHFGDSLGILKLDDGKYLYAIGSPGDASNLSGTVAVFKEINNTSTLSQTLKNNSTENDDEFGKSIDFVDNLLVVGSPGKDYILSNDAGLIVSYTCETSTGFCAETGGGVGYEIDHGTLSNQRLGDVLTATNQGGSPSLYASKSGLNLARYIYSPSDLAWLQINCSSTIYCNVWNSGGAMVYLDSYQNTLIASNNSSSAKISTDGSTFTTLSGTNGSIGPVAVIGDPNPQVSANLGIYVLAYDTSGNTTRIYKSVGISHFLKQVTNGTDFSGGSFTGSGAQLLLGSPSAGKVFNFR